jgi:RNA polymerase sigma-70 factor (ECF subfamily)
MTKMHDLLNDHIMPLRRYALALTRNVDQADALVQDTLAGAIESASAWDPRRDLRRWLFGIMHNVHVSVSRRRSLETNIAGQLTSITSDNVPAAQLDEVHFDETMTALMKLPEEQREVLALIGVEAFSYKDAAEMLGIPVGTVMSRLGRARDALRAAGGNRYRCRRGEQILAARSEVSHDGTDLRTGSDGLGGIETAHVIRTEACQR